MKLAARMSRLGTETAFEALANARALEAQGRSIIHLGIGEPDFDTPEHIRDAAKAAGRDPDTVGVQGRMSLPEGGPEQWREGAYRWQELGATHLTVNTSKGGFTSPAGHLELAQRFLTEVGHRMAS